MRCFILFIHKPLLPRHFWDPPSYDNLPSPPADRLLIWREAPHLFVTNACISLDPIRAGNVTGRMPSAADALATWRLKVMFSVSHFGCPDRQASVPPKPIVSPLEQYTSPRGPPFQVAWYAWAKELKVYSISKQSFMPKRNTPRLYWVSWV